MLQKVALKFPHVRRHRLLYLTLFLMSVAFVAVACGVESGNRRAARETPIDVFFRTQIGALEPTNVNLAVDEDNVCSATGGANLQFAEGERVRLSLQIEAVIQQGATGSLEVVGGGDAQAEYIIDGLEISSVTDPRSVHDTNGNQQVFNVTTGPRLNIDFSVDNVGTFDVLCNGTKIGEIVVSG